MRELEKSYKALANRRRLAILKYLKAGREHSVGQIAKEIELSFKSTSRHLAVLRAAGIVERDQIDLLAYYRLVPVQNTVTKHALSLL